MPFAPDYFAARARFRSAATRLGWTLEAFPVVEDLTIEAAILPGSGREPVLVTTSGIHGVEGIFGSAVQIAALEKWATAGPPRRVRCVFIHAVCPSGFAHIRRFNEENVDLNRNFLLPGEAYSGSPPGYAGLSPTLNPRRPPTQNEFFTVRALLGIARHGLTALKQAIAGGQFDFPRGIFFGGHEPSRSRAILEANVPRWLADSPRGVLLDLHSGLGRWSHFKLLIDAPPHSKEQLDRAARWFDPDLIEPTKPGGTAYHTRGGFDSWFTNAAGRDFISFCAEVGTYSLFRVLSSVRSENMAHHWCQPGDPRIARAKAELREMFCPASPEWQRLVVERGTRLIEQTIAGLQESG